MGPFDLIVIGGGIIGAGIARDAALRGLDAALFEKRDFGSGTTAGSTRLIHGGLRYLEMLDFRLVRMDLREREALLRIAPHLVHPLQFLAPLYGRSLWHRTRLRAGLRLYDALSFDRTLPGHSVLTTAETLALEPQLRRDGLQGSVAYYDAQVDSPERLTIDNIVDAREHGALTRNYCEVTGALRDGERVSGVRIRDTLTGEETEVRGRVVVNASGPWLDRVALALEPHPRRLLRTTKGIHLACSPMTRNAVVLFAPDGRLVFVIPWIGHSWIGTTDTDYDGDPARARASAADVQYLLRAAAPFFPALQAGDIFWTNAGVRALVRRPGRESSVSRLHRIVETAPGLVSIAGGKITGYRAIAEEAIDLVCRKLNIRRPCTTATTLLPGARAAVAQSDMAAQVRHAVRTEQCLRLADFMLRRSLLGFGRDQGMEEVARVTELMASELNWTPARSASEMQDYREWVAETQAFRFTAQST